MNLFSGKFIVRFLCFVYELFSPQSKFSERGMHYVFNHVDIEIKYRDGGDKEDWDGARLMSARVSPRR